MNTENCEFCKKNHPIDEMIYLEYNRRNAMYFVPDDVSPEDSQGLFLFGAKCALKILRMQGRRIREEKERLR